MSTETVRAARDRYLAENALSVESYNAPSLPIYVGRWAVQVPNPGYLPWHDLHHAVTGYRTGLIGEAEISAYELRGGCGSVMVFILCVGAIFFASFLAPRRIWRAWKRAKGASTLYHTKLPYETLLEMSVSDLRELLRIPSEGC